MIYCQQTYINIYSHWLSFWLRQMTAQGRQKLPQLNGKFANVCLGSLVVQNCSPSRMIAACTNIIKSLFIQIKEYDYSMFSIYIKKNIQVFGPFSRGYSYYLREWLSNARLLAFLTPKQYGTQIDNRQQSCKAVWSHEVYEIDANIVFLISNSVNPVFWGESRRPYEYDSIKWGPQNSTIG